MKTRSLAGLVAAAVTASVVAGTALGAASPSVNHDFTEARAAATQSDYAIVVLKDPPAASYAGGIGTLKRTQPERGQKLNPRSEEVRAYVSYLRGAQSEYRGWLGSKAKQAEVVRSYELAANALAIKLNGTKPETLSQGPGVKYVTGSWLYQRAMNVSVGLIKANALWPAAGGQANAGRGIKVGIIDSGIDDSHEFFACKQIPHKTYASGGNPPPFGLPTLVDDHGTHVAGTVAGCVTSPSKGVISETLSGVAPGAALYDYNVFPGYGAGYIAFGGSAFSHDICAAIEDSVADEMDVINMSLGGTVQGPHDFLAECTDHAVAGGLVAAVAASNDGPGDMTIGSPGNAPGALTAGASTNPHFIGVPFTADTVSGGAAYGDFPHFGDVTAGYTRTTPRNGCTAISEDLTGKIALIDRGVCTFGTKVRNAAAKGAVGVLVANNVAGDPVAMGGDGGAAPVPAAMVSKSDGTALGSSGTIAIDGDNVTEIKTQNADIIAGFSSRGPTPFTYLVKPDLTAPGVNVYSSVFGGTYAMFQGTSMATPHLAGAAALLLQRNPGWGPADVKSALVHTAARTVTDHVTGTVDPGVLARGGGRADLQAAAATPALISPASVSFGYFNGNAQANGTATLTVRATGAATTCTVAVTGGDGRATASAGTITATAAGSTLTLTFNGGRAAQTGSGDYSGDVVLNCGGTELKVPWWTRVSREGKP